MANLILLAECFSYTFPLDFDGINIIKIMCLSLKIRDLAHVSLYFQLISRKSSFSMVKKQVKEFQNSHSSFLHL